MSKIGSSVCGTSLKSIKRRFCYWFWCLLCVYLGPSTMYTISPIFLKNYSTFPTGRVILIFFKVNFFSRVEPFLGTNVVFRSLFCFGSSLSVSIFLFVYFFWTFFGQGINITKIWSQISYGNTALPLAPDLQKPLLKPTEYLMLFWVLALTYRQNVQPSRLILGDIAVWWCALFGRFRRTSLKSTTSSQKFRYLKILFCNFFGITTLSLYRRMLSHSENAFGTFSFFAAIFCLILVIKSSFIDSIFISSSITGSSLMVLAIMFLISQSVRKAAIIVTSKGSLYFSTNLGGVLVV